MMSNHKCQLYHLGAIIVQCASYSLRKSHYYAIVLKGRRRYGSSWDPRNKSVSIHDMLLGLIGRIRYLGAMNSVGYVQIHCEWNRALVFMCSTVKRKKYATLDRRSNKWPSGFWLSLFSDNKKRTLPLAIWRRMLLMQEVTGMMCMMEKPRTCHLSQFPLLDNFAHWFFSFAFAFFDVRELIL